MISAADFLGHLSRRGGGVAVAFVIASGLLAWSMSAQERSAAQPDRTEGAALYQQGLAAESRTDKPPDLAEAAQRYERAAQLGFAPAQTRLGYLYKTGSGVPRDPERAFRWISSAAAQHDPEAQFQLALLHLEGIGTPLNAAEARTWLARAGHDGRHQEAQFLLGLLLREGIGGRPNEGAAFEWMERAARGSNREIARRAAKAGQDLRASIRSKGEAEIGVGHILALAIASVAVLSAGSSYDSSVYDGSRQAAKIACERSCLNRAMATTRGALDMNDAYHRCRVGC